MATQDDVVNRAAYDLGVLRLGQALKAQDKKRLDAAYDEVYLKIKKYEAATWAGDVPDIAVPYVAALIADNALNTYGVSDIRYQRIKNEASLALARLRDVVTPDYETVDNPVDY